VCEEKRKRKKGNFDKEKSIFTRKKKQVKRWRFSVIHSPGETTHFTAFAVLLGQREGSDGSGDEGSSEDNSLSPAFIGVALAVVVVMIGGLAVVLEVQRRKEKKSIENSLNQSGLTQGDTSVEDEIELP
jgi:hypothetical protein